MAEYLAGTVAGLRVPAGPKDATATLWPLLADDGSVAALAYREPKIGLERSDRTRTAEEGMLYSIAFVRPRNELALGVLVDGVDGLVRAGDRLQALGGEGKLAGIRVGSEPDWPPMPPVSRRDGGLRFKLVLTTPVLWEAGGRFWLPPGFKGQKTSGLLSWRGELEFRAHTGARDRIEVEIVSACISRARKVGGWDLAANAPRPLVAYIPAGSVYFCRAAESAQGKVGLLHGGKLGVRTEYGFGHVVIGKW
jgi:CRISPR-associated protein Cmr3